MAKLQVSLRVDPALILKAQRALGVRSKTEVVERSLQAVIELERHRRMIRRFSGAGRRDDFKDS